jgi:hypothetical protein
MKRGLLLLLAAAVVVAGCTAGAPGSPPDSDPGADVVTGGTGDPVVKGWSVTRKFRGTIVGGRAYLKGRMRWSWRPGCPVDVGRLRLLKVDYWGFDRRVHRGELVVHRDHARRILAVLEKLFNAHYPIQRMRLVDAYRADDDRSMAANNTSGFNCRKVSGSSHWSEHAYGRAVDLNPLRTPG